MRLAISRNNDTQESLFYNNHYATKYWKEFLHTPGIIKESNSDVPSTVLTTYMHCHLLPLVTL